MSLKEDIIKGKWLSFLNDEKLDYEFILSNSDAVFVLPVIDNEKIVIRTEPIPAWHYFDLDELQPEENLNQYYTLIGGGIDDKLEDIKNLPPDDYREIALDNAEREMYEEAGIKLIDKTFSDLYSEDRLSFIGPLFNSKINTHRVSYVLVFLDSDEIEFKKPPTDGSKNEQLSHNIVMDYDKKVVENLKLQGDMGINLLVLELENMMNLSLEENIYKEKIEERINMYENSAKNEFALVIGRFQPFTNGHLKMINELYQKTQSNVIIGIVEGKKSSQDKVKNPLDYGQRAQLITQALKETNIPFIVMKFENGYLPSIIETINNNVNKVNKIYMACGSDRFPTYTRLLDKAKEEIEDLDYELVEIKRTGEDISATKIRNAIKTGDYDYYSKNVPEGIADENTFEKLKGILLFNG